MSVRYPASYSSVILVKNGQPFYIDLMPRVSDEHLNRRRRQIMEAALRCFARKGFHDTTLQDVFRESGLSAGAVYRYFKSKDELVQAIAAELTGPATAMLEWALAQDQVPGADEIAGGLAAHLQELSGPDGPAALPRRPGRRRCTTGRSPISCAERSTPCGAAGLRPCSGCGTTAGCRRKLTLTRSARPCSAWGPVSCCSS